MPQGRDPTKGRKEVSPSTESWISGSAKSPDDFPDEERAAASTDERPTSRSPSRKAGADGSSGREMPSLQYLDAESVRDIADLARQAREAQDRLLNKMRVEDRFEDGKLIETEAMGTLDTLDATRGNRALDELKRRIEALSQEARHELMAIMWIGRGDFAAADWDRAIDHAASSADASTVDFIAERAPLQSYLLKGLYQLKLA